MSPVKLLVSAFVVLACVEGLFSCSCLFPSYSSMVDDSEILLRVLPESYTTYGDHESGLRYITCKVIKVYKGCAYRQGELIYIRTPIQSSACGINPSLNEEYLVSAKGYGEYRDGRPVVETNACDIYREWSSLSSEEMEYLCDIYQDCPIGICPDYSDYDFDSGCSHPSNIGWGKVNGQCRRISGCSDQGYKFWTSEAECKFICGTGTCVELGSWDFAGSCCANSSRICPVFSNNEMDLGWGVYNGKCSMINGCDTLGFTLWETYSGCERNCLETGQSPDCPAGLHKFNCIADPCQEFCSDPDADHCESNYCGGCNAVWYDSNGNALNC